MQTDSMHTTTIGDIRAAMPPILPHYGKFDRGRLFLIAGSYGMAGAAVLAARAALRSGVGFLDVALPESIYPIVTAAVPEAVCTVYREDDRADLGRKIREGVKKADAVAAGPGLGKNRELVMPVLFSLSGKKLLLDADALNFLAQEAQAGPVSLSFEETALTPHSGEMARLIGRNRPEVEKDRFQALSDAVGIFHACCLLKGQNTLISSAEGTVYVNPTGNAGLGRAGSGDTLTGIAGALLAQGMGAFEALYSAAFVHGRAGDLCRDETGIRSYLPEDLIACLPRVFAEIDGGTRAQ